MLDWPARIDDLAYHLATEHRMEDRVALEILLSALVPCPRTPQSWLILESNWFSRECGSAWFSFGGVWQPHSLAQVRARQPWRPVVQMVNDWLDAPPVERLFIEPDYDRYPYYHALHNALFLVSKCLRVRTLVPRTAAPIATLDELEAQRRADGLRERLRAVIEDRAGARPTAPPVFREPPNFLYWAELVQRLSPWYRDWGELTRAFGSLAIRHAYLHGRSETTEEDWTMMARSAADSVPVWIAKAVKMMAAGGCGAVAVEASMGFEQKRRSDRGARAELHRLAKSGLIEWHPRKRTWEMVEKHARALAAVLDGRAFMRADTAAASR